MELPDLNGLSFPLTLILSGVPDLRRFVQPYEQLDELLLPVYFEKIDSQSDLEEMNNLCFAYGDTGDIDFEPLATKDFYERLAFACGNRWGLVIELVIEALTLCKMDDRKEISMPYFEQAYAQKSGLSLGFSPFSVDDYREAFAEAQLLKLLLDDE